MGAMKISTGTHQSTKYEFGPMVSQLNGRSEESTQGLMIVDGHGGIGNGESYFVHFIDAMLKTLEYAQVF